METCLGTNIMAEKYGELFKLQTMLLSVMKAEVI